MPGGFPGIDVPAGQPSTEEVVDVNTNFGRTDEAVADDQFAAVCHPVDLHIFLANGRLEQGGGAGWADIDHQVVVLPAFQHRGVATLDIGGLVGPPGSPVVALTEPDPATTGTIETDQSRRFQHQVAGPVVGIVGGQLHLFDEGEPIQRGMVMGPVLWRPGRGGIVLQVFKVDDGRIDHGLGRVVHPDARVEGVVDAIRGGGRIGVDRLIQAHGRGGAGGEVHADGLVRQDHEGRIKGPLVSGREVGYLDGRRFGPGLAVVVGELDSHPVPGGGGLGFAKPLEGGDEGIPFPADEGGHTGGILEDHGQVELLPVGTGGHQEGVVPRAGGLGVNVQA